MYLQEMKRSEFLRLMGATTVAAALSDFRAISQTVEALGVVGAPPLGLRYLRMAGRETPTESASSCMFTLLPWALLPFMRYARRLRKMSFMVSSPAVGTKVSAASNTRSRLCLGSLGGLGSRGGLGSAPRC